MTANSNLGYRKLVPSGLWRCWLAGRLAYGQLMPLPLTVSCFRKTQIGFTFLVLAHPGSPGKRAVKWVCVYVVIWNYMHWVESVMASVLSIPANGLLTLSVRSRFCQWHWETEWHCISVACVADWHGDVTYLGHFPRSNLLNIASTRPERIRDTPVIFYAAAWRPGLWFVLFFVLVFW